MFNPVHVHLLSRPYWLPSLIPCWHCLMKIKCYRKLLKRARWGEAEHHTEAAGREEANEVSACPGGY